MLLAAHATMGVHLDFGALEVVKFHLNHGQCSAYRIYMSQT